ncbi:MAG: signal peptidase I [Acidobacteriota bacterium]
MTPAKGFWRENLETILVCVIFVLFARTFVFQQSKIPTGSMENTLLVGDYILVNRFQFAPALFSWEKAILPERPVHRGDVVVFKYPKQVEVDYIKRVIGLPADLLEIRDGRVFINGRPLKEPYVVHKGGAAENNYGPVRVPEGHYFMLGDNRDRSADSRQWGFVPRDHLQGRAIFIWWSYEEDRQDYLHTHFFERLHSIASKMVNFFTRTRWSRTFNLIH